MNKKSKKKILKSAIIILLIITLTISMNLNRNFSKFEEALKDTAMILNKTIQYPINSNNKNQKDQTESYIIQKNVNVALEKEIQELKEMLNLNKTLTEYDIENATILSRNNAYWFNTITVDKGKKDGIKKDMAVVTSAGLIGKVSKVSQKSSEIKLITSDDVTFKISVAIRVNDVDNYAILNGYDENKKLLKVTGISKTTPINKGDVVLTSGLGQIPQGIYIGTVEDIQKDKYDLSKILYIKTTQNFNDIHYVTILKEKK